MYISGILGEMELRQGATPWLCENRGIQATTITGFNGRTRHVDMHLKFSQECIDNGLFGLPYVPTTKQLADSFTRLLRTPSLVEFINWSSHVGCEV